MDDAQSKLLLELGQNRRLAHTVLFEHRHPFKTPPFHYRIIDLFHSNHPRVVIEAFRDAAKSTVAEEAIIIAALYREFRNAVLIGASYARARDRLTSIKNELVNNKWINNLFGPMEGPSWGEGRIILSNGVCITAIGSGASMRGTKYLEARPDFALIDDLEDEETVRTPEAREQTMHWLYRTFIPALAQEHRVRFLGNRLDADAVIVKLSRDAAWRHLRFPIMGQSDSGTERPDLPPGRWFSLWPDKFPLTRIAETRAEYERLGLIHDFNCEYMCEAEDPATRLFSADQAKTVPHIRTYENVMAAYDPARTINNKSAMTGKAVFSWRSNRLIVWEGDARLWLPDEIVNDMLDTDQRWSLAELGVEATGLEEFIMQPLRHRSAQRQQLLPLRRLVPPRGKDTFIRGLQPFFKAGEIEFVNVSMEARAQLLSFPSGRKDFPNALAYALMMRSGQPVHDGFSRDHVVEEFAPLAHRPAGKMWLAINATTQYTCAILLRVVNGGMHVYGDWVREGPPGEALGDIVAQARLDATAQAPQLGVVLAPLHPGGVDTVGLRVAARSHQLVTQNGGDPLKGREAIRQLLTRRHRDRPALMVASAARWTLNGLSGAYAYDLTKRGTLSRESVDNVYRVLMEALESFAAAMGGVAREADDERRIAVDAKGREYATILPAARGERREMKHGW